MRNYLEASTYLGKKTDRPLGTGRATRIIRRSDDAIDIRYQATDVVTYYADGRITLNSDGWHTVTTRARFNEYSPISVYSHKGMMRVAVTGANGYPDWDNYKPYTDGLTLLPDGTLQYPAGFQDDVCEREKLLKRIARYAKGFGQAVTDGTIGEPSKGDCLYCQMELSQRMTGHTGIQYGAVSRDGVTDLSHVGPHPNIHYPAHLDERYYMGSLLANACIVRKFGNPQLVYTMMIARKDGKWAAQTIRRYLKSLIPQLLEKDTHA